MKNINRLSSLLLIPITFTFSSCRKANGGLITYSSIGISKTPVMEEKRINILDQEFIYFNVYNDGNDNFVLTDKSSYIKNER